MTWNYRVIKRTYDIGWCVYGIHETYYDDNGEVSGWTTNRSEPHGENLEELQEDLKKMLDAFNKPVLDEEALLERAAKKGKKDE